ncbi:polysaccharide deacetylase family protein [Kineococcus sp. SYSU DK003]|uniref:polysaccharide deacetylase family protein n=1 Tax=Kineococcus sp. SYSU DK003 TaxID=3383124 RepID=UPI003D7D7FAB
MRRRPAPLAAPLAVLLAALFAVVAVAGLPAAAADPGAPKPPVPDAVVGPAAPRPGETVVSLTFDDGFKTQEAAAEVLAGRGMPGTFYVNAGSLGYPAYLTVDQVRGIAAMGHEIGGHGLDHDRLTEMPPAAVRAQVCVDRATLAALGLDVRSFAYPYGAVSEQVRQVVQDCGYSSARAASGLWDSPTECDSCPRAEDPATMDTWKIRTSGTATTPDLLRQRVEQAEQAGGGWVPLVFHHVCTCPEKAEAGISPGDFTAFVEWLAARPAGTRVATVAQVAGGDPRPVVGAPLQRIVAGPAAPASSRRVAFSVAGVQISQSNVIVAGLVVATGALVAYRFGTRGKRYAGRKG